jgi:hypothetical protein
VKVGVEMRGDWKGEWDRRGLTYFFVDIYILHSVFFA